MYTEICVLQAAYPPWFKAALRPASQLSGQERRIPTSRITLITDTFDISNTRHAEIPAREGGGFTKTALIVGGFVEQPACRLLLK